VSDLEGVEINPELTLDAELDPRIRNDSSSWSPIRTRPLRLLADEVGSGAPTGCRRRA
jgi:hypothetical protein